MRLDLIRARGALTLALAVVATVLSATPQLATAAALPRGANTVAATTAPLSARNIDVSGLTVTRVTGLTVGIGAEANGYVNLWDDADLISMRVTDAPRSQYEDNLLHEYGHIVQRRVIDRHSGAGWWERTATIARLDHALRRASPPVRAEAAASAAPGLEANADCIAIVVGGRVYRPWYVDAAAACGPRELAAARTLIEGDWPSEAKIRQWGVVLEEESAVARDRRRPS